ncbi:MAG: metallophosphoesterase [Propionibacteriaceae bacterium]|nr:metallophosphoesterase [Propionibacteriaceae bacterium]
MTIIIVVVGVAIVWLYLFFSLIRLTHLTKGWAITATIAMSLILVGSVLAAILSRIMGTSDFRVPIMAASLGISVVFYLCLGLIPVVAIAGVIWFFTRPLAVQATHAMIESGQSTGKGRLLTIRILTVFMIVMSLAVTGYGFVRAQQPKLSPVTLQFDSLPSSFDGFTIALITDLHIGAATRTSFLPSVVAQVNAATPDLIVIAGDTVNGSVEDLGEQMSILGDLIAPYGVVLTTGNHDFYPCAPQWMEYFSSLGLTVLDNDGILLQRGQYRIQVLGIHDKQGEGEMAPDLDQATQRVSQIQRLGGESFGILVAHEPVQVFDPGMRASGVSLQLSGHTHGGQLFPWGIATLFKQPTLDGVHRFNGVTLVTSRGVGNWASPVRVGADPEIPIITLVTTTE